MYTITKTSRPTSLAANAEDCGSMSKEILPLLHSFAFYAAAGPGPTSGGPLPTGPGDYPTFASESRTLSFIYTSSNVHDNPMQTSSVAFSFRHILVHTIKAKSSKQSNLFTNSTSKSKSSHLDLLRGPAHPSGVWRCFNEFMELAFSASRPARI